MVTINRDEIFEQGFVDVKVHVTGLRQCHRLAVVKEDTNRGIFTYLESKHYIPTSELVRISEILQLPIKHNATVVFPKGKMPKDFLEKKAVVTVEAETIEAEIEDDEPEEDTSQSTKSEEPPAEETTEAKESSFLEQVAVTPEEPKSN
ncbi:MAG: hypothetical protein ABH983_05050 [Candidatus Micrarchaeota archaeon]